MLDTVDPAAEEAAFETPFMKALVQWLFRAQDQHGFGERKTDAQIPSDFIVTKEQRREMPIIGDPDPTSLAHRDVLHGDGLCCRGQDRRHAGPMMKMSHEGWPHRPARWQPRRSRVTFAMFIVSASTISRRWRPKARNISPRRSR